MENKTWLKTNCTFCVEVAIVTVAYIVILICFRKEVSSILSTANVGLTILIISITYFIILTAIATCCLYPSKQITKISNYIAMGITIGGVLITWIFLSNDPIIGALISCILAMFSIILVLFGRTKNCYTFNNEYNGIQKEYDHLCELEIEKQIYNGKSLIEECVSDFLNGIRYNISNFYSYFLRGIMDYTKNGSEKENKDNKRKTFFQYNFKNAHDYVFLSNHKEIVHDEIFSNIFYNVYEKVSIDFLAPLVFETNTKVPDFISRELDNAILETQGVLCQLNTSLQEVIGLETFYDNYQNEDLKCRNTEGYKSRRLFLYSDIDKYFDIIPNSEVKGLNSETKSFAGIPLILWLFEWHKQNGYEVGFVSCSEARKEQYSSKNINALDFSITHIKRADKNNMYNDIILQITGQHNESFYNKPMIYYSLSAFVENYQNETIDAEAEHYCFYKKLWNKRLPDIDIINKIKTNFSLYNQLTNKNVVNRYLSSICMTTPIE